MEVIQNISCAAINHSWERCLNLQLPQNDVSRLQAFSYINLSLWFALLHLVHKSCVKKNKTRPITEQFSVFIGVWSSELCYELECELPSHCISDLLLSFTTLTSPQVMCVSHQRTSPELRSTASMQAARYSMKTSPLLSRIYRKPSNF